MGLNMDVVSGGQWNKTRAAEQGYLLENKICGRCQAEEETLMHRVWMCAKNVDHEDFTSTDALLPAAMAQAVAEPSLWLRGLPPASHPHTLQ